MELYFKSGLFMPEVKDESAMLIYIDSPFAINHKDGSQYNRKKDSLPYREWTVPEYHNNIRTIFTAAWKKLHPQGNIVLWCAWNRMGDALMHIQLANELIMMALELKHAAYIPMGHIIWKYPFGVSTKRKLTASHYHGLWFAKSKNPKFNLVWAIDDLVKGHKRPYAEDVWTIPRAYQHGKKTARNEQPIQLALKAITYFTDPNDLVVDVCCGSGTVLAACALSERRYLGYELEPALQERIVEKTALTPVITEAAVF